MASVAAIFAGCSNDEDALQTTDSLKDKPINVDVMVSGIHTRAGYDNDNSLPTMFYLSIDQNGSNYDYNNVVMKYEKGKWVAYESADENAAKKQLLWEGSEGNVTVTAATFPLPTNATSYTLSANTNQSTADAVKASDHLYYYSNAVKPSENGTISIPFDHIMSKLEITVTLRTQYGASENPITSAIAFGSATSATYSHAGETPWSNYNSAVSDISLCPSGSYSAAERTATYEAIFIPQNIAASTFGVKVKIGDKTYTWKSANAVTFEGGKKYTLNLTLGKDELTLNTLSVSNWNEETVEGLNAKHIPYVTFTAESEQTFNMYCNDFSLGENEYFEYSVGGGEWVSFKEIIENIKFGGSHGNLRLRGKSSKGTATDPNNYLYSEIQFTNANSPVDCTGDIRTLIDYENYANANTTNARFCNLFLWNTELRTAPALPALELASYCYYAMFNGCSKLTTAPELPAKSLEGSCYKYMFSGCSSLTTAPAELPATTLADFCYEFMFSGCTKLTEAPALPAQILADYCYQYMFQNCTSLTTAPELRAETLAHSCYQEMFSGCSALSSVTMLAFDVSAQFCLDHWLIGAGTNVQEPQKPTLYLDHSVYYEYVDNKEFDEWAPKYQIYENWVVQPQPYSE